MPLSLFRSYPLPFSPPFLLYCSLPFLFFCLFHWSISAAVSGEAFYLPVFATVAICFLTRRNLECPCLFSDFILFPFILLFFYIVPYPSFSSMSMSFSLIYICCSFRGGILSVVFRTVATCFWPAGTWSALVSFPILSSSLFSSFSSILFLTLPFLLCLFHWSISAVVSGEAFYLLFSHCSLMFLTRREPGVPCLFSDLILFPFLLLFLLYCSLPFLFFYVFFIDLDLL